VFQSALFNNRGIIDQKSRMLSYMATRAGDAAQTNVMVEYDGNKANGEMPVQAEKFGNDSELAETGDSDGNGRTKIFYWDKARGEEFKGTAEPPNDTQVTRYWQVVSGMDILGSIDPIAMGNLDRTGVSGRLAETLISAALEFISPFLECMEESYVWAAEEIARQYIRFKGKYKFRGYDKTREFFNVEVEPSQITDEENFTCEIVIDRLRNRSQELEMAIREVSYGMSSIETAMDTHHLHGNPDMEKKKIWRERAENMPVMELRYLCEQALDDGDISMAWVFYMASEEAKKQLIAGIIAPGMQQQGKPGTTSQLEPNRIAAEQRG